MGFTYSGNPEHSPRDATRLLIGDTDPGDPLLSDEEIKIFLDNYNQTPLNAAIRCCEVIIAKLARRPDEKVGSVSISYSQQAKAYRDLLADLKRRIAVDDAAPYAGGISHADKNAQTQNADRVKPKFRKDLMDDKNTSPFVPGNPFDNEEFIGG